jgi:hypothetical protein
MRCLVFMALWIAGVEGLPQVAHQLRVLGLLLVIQVGEFLDLIGSNQVGMLLWLRHGLLRRHLLLLAWLALSTIHIGDHRDGLGKRREGRRAGSWKGGLVRFDRIIRPKSIYSPTI